MFVFFFVEGKYSKLTFSMIEALIFRNIVNSPVATYDWHNGITILIEWGKKNT